MVGGGRSRSRGVWSCGLEGWGSSSLWGFFFLKKKVVGFIESISDPCLCGGSKSLDCFVIGLDCIAVGGKGMMISERCCHKMSLAT